MSNDNSVVHQDGTYTSVTVREDNGLVTHNGVEMPREVAVQHGYRDPSDNSMVVQPNHGFHRPAPAEVGPDGVPMSIAIEASKQYRDIVMNADHQMLARIEADFLDGDPMAEEFLMEHAPHMIEHGWQRADNWCQKLGIDVNMLSTGLIDQETKGRMIKAIFQDNESMFQRHITEAKQALLHELHERGLHNFELNGHIPNHRGDTPDGNIIDMLLRGEIDIED